MSELWRTEEFLSDVHDWVREVCRPHGIAPTGEWEQPHCRPWSSAIRFETNRGRLWFKVNGPGTRYEGALVSQLNRTIRDLAPEMIAHDVALGWWLARDAGPSMRSVAAANQLWQHWEALITRYAEAQIVLARHRDRLIAAGIRELTCVTLPRLARELTDELARLPEREGGLTKELVAAIESRLPDYDRWCNQLARCGIPDSLQHDDLHSANVCWRTDAASARIIASAASARIIDWGDASWGQPLGTMLGTLDSIVGHAGLALDDARVQRVRDAYLEPFAPFAPRPALIEATTLARRIGCLTKALAWRAALMDAPLDVHIELEFPIRDWLLRITTP